MRAPHGKKMEQHKVHLYQRYPGSPPPRILTAQPGEDFTSAKGNFTEVAEPRISVHPSPLPFFPQDYGTCFGLLVKHEEASLGAESPDLQARALAAGGRPARPRLQHESSARGAIQTSLLHPAMSSSHKPQGGQRPGVQRSWGIWIHWRSSGCRKGTF